jgi:hypothetical protein
MNRVRGYLGVLYPQICEQDPQQLDELNRDEKRPQSNPRKLSFQGQGC